jgi:hypothetical protein
MPFRRLNSCPTKKQVRIGPKAEGRTTEIRGKIKKFLDLAYRENCCFKKPGDEVCKSGLYAICGARCYRLRHTMCHSRPEWTCVAISRRNVSLRREGEYQVNLETRKISNGYYFGPYCGLWKLSY